MKRTPIPKNADIRAYRQLWRIVDGAVADAFGMHPDYLRSKRVSSVARRSVVKRVVGAINGFVEQSTRGRSGEEPAAETGAASPKGRANPALDLGAEAAVATPQLAGADSGPRPLIVPDYPAWFELMKDQPA